MDRFNKEVEDLVKKKGFNTEGMTGEEMTETFKEATKRIFPHLIDETNYRVVREILEKDMKTAGRNKICRFHIQYPAKQCRENSETYDLEYEVNLNMGHKYHGFRCSLCPNYRPLTWWQNLLTSPNIWIIAELTVILIVGLSVTMYLLSPELRTGAIVAWFLLILVTRIHNIILRRQMKKLTEKNLLTNL